MFQGVNVQKTKFQSLGRSHLLTGRNLEALGPGPASENSCRLSLPRFQFLQRLWEYCQRRKLVDLENGGRKEKRGSVGWQLAAEGSC